LDGETDWKLRVEGEGGGGVWWERRGWGMVREGRRGRG